MYTEAQLATMSNDELAKAKANEVAEYLRDQAGVPEVKCFSIILILALAGFILQVITFMRTKHKNPKEALAIMQKPGTIQRWQLRRMLKQHLGDQYQELHYKSGGVYFYYRR
jgi:hypothetical protein